MLQRRQSPSDAPMRVAEVGKTEGSVYVLRGGRRQSLPDGLDGTYTLLVGDTLVSSGDGGVALTLAHDVSLRIDGGTQLKFDSTSQASLDRGRIYVDSGVSSSSADAAATVSPGAVFDIATPFGTVTHLGTQYELVVDSSALTLRVREGSVAIGHGAARLVGTSGEQLTLRYSGAAERANIATDGASWSWAENLAAVPHEDRYAAFMLLTWIARETGRHLQFANASVEARARSTMLHGVEGLNPDETLDVLRGTTDLVYTLQGDVLLVRKPTG
jgi:hypothetical protein